MHSRQAGLTLPELLVSLLITSILTLYSISAWSSKIQSTRLEGRAQELIQDLHWMRSQAVATKERIRLSVQQSGSGSCYVIHTGQAHDCTCTAQGQSSCQAPAHALKTVGFPNAEGVSLSSNNQSMLWDPVHGTTTPAGTLSVRSGTDRQVNVVVNILGRPRTCSVQTSLPGYPLCK